MEWILAVVAVYMIVAVYTSWQCETALAEDMEHRALVIFLSAFLWPIGLLIYYLSPELQEERRRENDRIKAAEEESRRKEQKREEEMRKADRDYADAEEFLMIFLNKQKQQLEKNLAELEEDDPGRAILKEGIRRTEELMLRHGVDQEPELLNK